jgi:hypothetical protein
MNFKIWVVHSQRNLRDAPGLVSWPKNGILNVQHHAVSGWDSFTVSYRIYGRTCQPSDQSPRKQGRFSNRVQKSAIESRYRANRWLSNPQAQHDAKCLRTGYHELSRSRPCWCIRVHESNTRYCALCQFGSLAGNRFFLRLIGICDRREPRLEKQAIKTIKGTNSFQGCRQEFLD